MSHYLVQLILPLYDPDGRPFGRDALVRVRRELTDRFGGTTAYTRAPAEGTWEDPEGRVQHDDVVVVEVMTDTLDRPWGAGTPAIWPRDFGRRRLSSARSRSSR